MNEYRHKIKEYLRSELIDLDYQCLSEVRGAELWASAWEHTSVIYAMSDRKFMVSASNKKTGKSFERKFKYTYQNVDKSLNPSEM